jgi:hypothetical protein
MTRQRLAFVTVLVTTCGLLIAGLVMYGVHGLGDRSGTGLCLAATGTGIAYAVGRAAHRNRGRR